MGAPPPNPRLALRKRAFRARRAVALAARGAAPGPRALILFSVVRIWGLRPQTPGSRSGSAPSERGARSRSPPGALPLDPARSSFSPDGDDAAGGGIFAGFGRRGDGAGRR